MVASTSQPAHDTAFVCPNCLGQLGVKPEELACPGCAAAYKLLHGIPMLCRDTGFYYGEIPREAMKEVLADAEQLGWQRAIWKFSAQPDSKYFVRYVTSCQRATAKFLLDRFGEADVLDYGCGLGVITVSLATNYRTVFATDLTYERVAFTAARARQNGLNNVRAFCCGDMEHIPLPNGAVDIVLLNGVLEWVGEWGTGNPRQLQVEFLREIRRVLRPDGLLFVAIENRTAHTYLRGKREDHTGLRFGALLPRSLANAYSLLLRKRPYRTYTYTQAGYRRLLADAGFSHPSFYALLPDYRQPERVVDLASPQMRKSLPGGSLRKKVRRAAVQLLLPRITHSFGITAGAAPERNTQPFFRSIVEHISATSLGGRACTVEAYSLLGLTPTVQIRAFCAPERFVVHLPLDRSMEERVTRRYVALVQVHALGLNGEWKKALPRPIATGRYEGQLYSARAFMPGQTVGRADLRRNLDRFLPQISRFLIDLGQVTKSPSGTWESFLHGMALQAASELLARGDGIRDLPDIQNKLERMLAYITENAPQASACSCAAHGDFWYGNILLSPAGQVCGVIDWDRFERTWLPASDLLYLLVCAQETCGVNPYVAVHEQLAQPGIVRDCVRGYCRALEIPAEIVPLVLMHTWMSRMAMDLRSEQFSRSPMAIRMNIGVPLDYFSGLGS